MGIVFGCIVPHPPLLIPDIGRGHEQLVNATIRAMEELCRRLEASRPETLMIVSPHGQSHYDAMGVLTASSCQGDMRSWGSSTPGMSFKNDTELVNALIKECRSAGIPLRSIGERSYHLDHGVMVPLHFLAPVARGLPLVPLTFSWLPLGMHFAFGQALRRAVEAVGRRAALIASGDLSHRLTPDAPAGYHPDGKVFDEKLVKAVAEWDKEAVLNMDSDFIERAGECGLRSIVILLGALEGLQVRPQVLSYEGPFGVGYLVASVEVVGPGNEEMDPFVRLAKQAVETYVREGRVLQLKEVPPEMQRRAGVFASLKKFGELRGCIGTFEPSRENIAQEIIASAISSATQDPRFPPVTPDELPYLSYSVDILSPPEPVSDVTELDPKKYGIIVESGWRRGLLLPDLEGVDTVEQQIQICRQKAGIGPHEPIKIYRFRVERHK